MKHVIYQIFPRNYSNEGTLNSITNDLERIKKLGIDIIYLMPIHEIGILNRKGKHGSPYSIKDYKSISKDLGSLNDFQKLVIKTHSLGMKIILDMVFNHTARDNPLTKTHPEYYFYRDGLNANKVGDWTDVCDLETLRDDTQEYLLDVIKYWVELGVDGFRFDVASLLPINFFKKLRLKFGNRLFLLAESIDDDFKNYCKQEGISVVSDEELSQYFNILYNYNYYRDLEAYLKGETTLNGLVNKLNNNDNKLSRISALENHDTERILYLLNNDRDKFISIVQFMFFIKGCPFIYNGMELFNNHRPNLFEKDPINWADEDKEIYGIFESLISEYSNRKEIVDQHFDVIEDKIKVTTKYKDDSTDTNVFSF